MSITLYGYILNSLKSSSYKSVRFVNVLGKMYECDFTKIVVIHDGVIINSDSVIVASEIIVHDTYVPFTAMAEITFIK